MTVNARWIGGFAVFALGLLSGCAAHREAAGPQRLMVMQLQPPPLQVAAATPHSVVPFTDAERKNPDFPNFDVLTGIVDPTNLRFTKGVQTVLVGPTSQSPVPIFTYVVGHRGRIENRDIIVYAEGTTFAIWYQAPDRYHVFHYGHNHDAAGGPSQTVEISLKRPAPGARTKVTLIETSFVDVRLTPGPSPDGEDPSPTEPMPVMHFEAVNAVGNGTPFAEQFIPDGPNATEGTWVFAGLDPERLRRLVTIEAARKAAGLRVSRKH